MKARHWERIANITEHVFEVDSDNFLLRNIMEAPILANKDDIEVSGNFLVIHEILSHSLHQGWRTFFGERAKILKIKFSQLMPCH